MAFLAFLAGPIGRWLVVAAIVAAALAGTYHKVKMVGWNEREAVAIEAALEADRLAAALAVKREAITVQVVTKYRDRIKVVEKHTEGVTRYVDRYIPAGACALPGGFRVLHDAAAAGQPIPETAAGTDGAATVPAKVATTTVTTNYAQCRLNAEQLIALQEWVSEQERARP